MTTRREFVNMVVLPIKESKVAFLANLLLWLLSVVIHDCYESGLVCCCACMGGRLSNLPISACTITGEH